MGRKSGNKKQHTQQRRNEKSHAPVRPQASIGNQPPIPPEKPPSTAVTESEPPSKRRIAAAILVLAIAFIVAYFKYSYANPELLSVAIDVVAIGVAVGLVRTVFQSWVDGKLHEASRPALVISFSVLFICVALKLYSSGKPKHVSKEIPVTFLLHYQTTRPPETIRSFNSDGDYCYGQGRELFNLWRMKNPQAEGTVQTLLHFYKPGTDQTSHVRDMKSGYAAIRDFLEYLVPHCTWKHVRTQAEEIYSQRGTAAEYFAIPNREIDGANELPLNKIGGEFSKNPFYVLKKDPKDEEDQFGLRLPVNTTVTVTNDLFESKFTFENEFYSITIRIRLTPSVFGQPAFPDPKIFYPPEPFRPSEFANQAELERGGPYRRYDAIIFLDASFSKLRYGHYKMRYYEAWVDNLFVAIERKFAWGKPALRDPFDILPR